MFLVPLKGRQISTLTNIKKEPYIHSPKTTLFHMACKNWDMDIIEHTHIGGQHLGWDWPGHGKPTMQAFRCLTHFFVSWLKSLSLQPRQVRPRSLNLTCSATRSAASQMLRASQHPADWANVARMASNTSESWVYNSLLRHVLSTTKAQAQETRGRVGGATAYMQLRRSFRD